MELNKLIAFYHKIKKIERYFEKIFIIKNLKNFKKMLDKKTIIHYNL